MSSGTVGAGVLSALEGVIADLAEVTREEVDVSVASGTGRCRMLEVDGIVDYEVVVLNSNVNNVVTILGNADAVDEAIRDLDNYEQAFGNRGYTGVNINVPPSDGTLPQDEDDLDLTGILIGVAVGSLAVGALVVGLWYRQQKLETENDSVSPDADHLHKNLIQPDLKNDEFDEFLDDPDTDGRRDASPDASRTSHSNSDIPREERAGPPPIRAIGSTSNTILTIESSVDTPREERACPAPTLAESSTSDSIPPLETSVDNYSLPSEATTWDESSVGLQLSAANPVSVSSTEDLPANMFAINMADLQLGNVIASGTGGWVCEGQYVEQRCAVKELHAKFTGQMRPTQALPL